MQIVILEENFLLFINLKNIFLETPKKKFLQ